MCGNYAPLHRADPGDDWPSNAVVILPCVIKKTTLVVYRPNL